MTGTLDRRSVLRVAGFAAVLRAARSRASTDTGGAAANEDYWRQIRGAFDLDRRFIDLQSSSVSPSSVLAQSALVRSLETVNSLPAYHLFHYGRTERTQAKARLAALLSCSPDELALLRNTTEAMTAAIQGLELQPGDEILTTSLDYPPFLTAWRMREKRDGIRLRVVDLPFGPLSREQILERVTNAVTERTRVLMVCHVLMGSGQVVPTEEICAAARERGIVTLIDGAHGFGHAPCELQAIGCDYYGCSLHKWANAPLGTGFLYVRRERIA